MSVEKLCGGVNHHVSSERNRLLEVWRHEGVVHYKRHFFAAANLANGCDIAQRHQWIGWRFDVDHASVFAGDTLYISRVSGIEIGKLHSEIRQNLVEKAGHTTIKIVAADDMVSGFVHGADGVDGRHATGENTRGDAAFEGRQVLFQPGTSGIRNASVFVALVLAQLLLDVCGCWVDGNRHRAGFGIGVLAGVNGLGSETWLLVLHGSFRTSAVSHQFLRYQLTVFSL